VSLFGGHYGSEKKQEKRGLTESSKKGQGFDKPQTMGQGN
jgi:hypothetical protein